MYVIIPSSEKIKISFLKETYKTMFPISGKVILQYILDELYSYQEYIDKIIIVGDSTNFIEEYLSFNKQDDFFLTKICCISNKNYRDITNKETSFFDDFYTGVKFLVDTLKVCPSEILLWHGSELVLDSKKLIDLSLESFVCINDKNIINIFRFNDFISVVNSLVYLNEHINSSITIQDFLTLYKKNNELILLEDFGNYKKWDTQKDYYNTQSYFLENNTHNSILINVNLSEEQITKTNKYVDYEYSYYINELSREVQYNLWSEAKFLSSATQQQSVFLPELIDQGINKRGEYCDWITEEFIHGITLDSILLYDNIESWKDITIKIINTLQNIFHIDELEDSDELYTSYVPKHTRENSYIVDVKNKFCNSVLNLKNEFSYDNREINNFVMDNNSIVEWNIFIDDFINEYSKRINKDNIIYNGSCNRLIHNNLTFDNIICDYYTNRIYFINPRSRKWDIIDKNIDYVYLYLSCYAGISVLNNNFYTIDCKGTININENLYKKMLDCTKSFDDLLTDNIFLKMYAILVLLLESSKQNKYSTENRIVMLKYARQLKNSFYQACRKTFPFRGRI